MHNLFKSIFLIILILIINIQCSQKNSEDDFLFDIVEEAVSNKQSPFFINTKSIPDVRNDLPIGVFDSGTGGLTVLNSIVDLDEFNNEDHSIGSDGIPDFINESFVYLADEVNMPYGKYDGEGKADFLRELVLKDVIFLLKDPVKSIVIACNTATAFGLDTCRKAMEYWDLGVNISGIIEAGSREAIRVAPRNKSDPPVIGILATQGTCSSEAYPATIEKLKRELHPDSELYTVQQAGIGLAGAIDGDLNYIDLSATSSRDSTIYFGPGLNHPEFPISKDFWGTYNFKEGNGLFTERDERGELLLVQLNSVENYVKYMVTHLVMNILYNSHDPSLDLIILGCTHYPYVDDEIMDHLNYLRNRSEDWKRIISVDLQIIDPAKSLAIELYESLNKQDLFVENEAGESRFFISVANPDLAENKISDEGEFPYSWKYGREINSMLEFVKRVPFSEINIHPDIKIRIKEHLPNTYDIINWNQ